MQEWSRTGEWEIVSPRAKFSFKGNFSIAPHCRDEFLSRRVALKSVGVGSATLGDALLGPVRAFNKEDSNDREISDVAFQLIEKPNIIYVLNIDDGSLKKLSAAEVKAIQGEQNQLEVRKKKGGSSTRSKKQRTPALHICNVALINNLKTNQGE